MVFRHFYFLIRDGAALGGPQLYLAQKAAGLAGGGGGGGTTIQSRPWRSNSLIPIRPDSRCVKRQNVHFCHKLIKVILLVAFLNKLSIILYGRRDQIMLGKLSATLNFILNLSYAAAVSTSVIFTFYGVAG